MNVMFIDAGIEVCFAPISTALEQIWGSEIRYRPTLPPDPNSSKFLSVHGPRRQFLTVMSRRYREVRGACDNPPSTKSSMPVM